MAYKQINENILDPNECKFVADAHADLATITSDNPDMPVGATVLVGDDDGNGTAAMYMMMPAGSLSKLCDLG